MFYKTVNATFTKFKQAKIEPLGLRGIIKVAYNHIITKITTPKVAILDDADRRAEAWRRLKKLDVAPEARGWPLMRPSQGPIIFVVSTFWNSEAFNGTSGL